MRSGIVMEVNKRKIIVMTPDGAFHAVPRKNRDVQIGEEIRFTPPRRRWTRTVVASFSAAVAVMVGCLFLISILSGNLGGRVVAYIAIDINPSVEMGVDRYEKVRELRGLNEDGIALVRNIDYMGKPVDEVTIALLDHLDESRFLQEEPQILVTSIPVRSKAKIDGLQLSEQVKETVSVHLQKKAKAGKPAGTGKSNGETGQSNGETGQSFGKVTAITAPADVREAAREQGVSPGKYTLYLQAKSSGLDVSLDQFKKGSVKEIAKTIDLEQLLPQIQSSKEQIAEQLKKERGKGKDKELHTAAGFKQQTVGDRRNQAKSGDNPKDRKTGVAPNNRRDSNGPETNKNRPHPVDREGHQQPKTNRMQTGDQRLSDTYKNRQNDRRLSETFMKRQEQSGGRKEDAAGKSIRNGEDRSNMQERMNRILFNAANIHADLRTDSPPDSADNRRDRSNGYFQGQTAADQRDGVGKRNVRPDAQRSDARQTKRTDDQRKIDLQGKRVDDKRNGGGSDKRGDDKRSVGGSDKRVDDKRNVGGSDKRVDDKRNVGGQPSWKSA